MALTAEVVEIHDEEGWHVTVRIGPHVLALFSPSSPYPIEIGVSYPVKLDFSNLEEPEVTLATEEAAAAIIPIDTAFGYTVTGTLRDTALHIGDLAFEDEETFADYRTLQGKTLRLKVARLAVEFL